MTLHVFYSDDAEEWYVASSPADANAAWIENCGDTPDEPMTVDSWILVDGNKAIKINLDDGRGAVTKTAAEWALESGRGPLCSRNW